MHFASRHLSILITALLFSAPACTSKPRDETPLEVAETGSEAVSLEQAGQLIDQGKALEAITAFRSLLRADGPSLSTLNGLGIAHAELGRADLAADFFERALALSPGDSATLNNIGFAALRRRETGLARRYLEMAEQAGDDTRKVHGNLKVLQQLEASRRVLVADAVPAAERFLSDKGDGKAIAVERRTASTVRLFRRQPTSGDPGTRQNILPQPNTALIDFSEVFDPWPTNDHPPKPSL